MVANPHKGEVEFELAGRTHLIRLNMNTICAIEEALGKGIAEIMDGLLASPEMRHVRVVLHAMLVGDYTLDEVGDLIMDEATPVQIMGWISEAARLSQSRRKAVVANPRKASSKSAAGRNSS